MQLKIQCLWQLLNMLTEGTEMQWLHPPKNYLDWWTERAEATLANNISRQDPPGPNGDHPPSKPSKSWKKRIFNKFLYLEGTWGSPGRWHARRRPRPDRRPTLLDMRWKVGRGRPLPGRQRQRRAWGSCAANPQPLAGPPSEGPGFDRGRKMNFISFHNFENRSLFLKQGCGSASFWTDADPDPTFNFYAYPDPDFNPSFTLVGKSEIFLTFIHSNASLHCIIFLGIVIIFNILDSILKFSGKKYSFKVGTNENGSACGRWLSIGI